MSEKAKKRESDKRKPRIVSGLRFLQALETVRVVIDATVDEPLKVYVENFGDERVLEVVTHPDLKVAIVERGA